MKQHILIKVGILLKPTIRRPQWDQAFKPLKGFDLESERVRLTARSQGNLIGSRV